MDTNKALQVLINAVQAANMKGAYSLQDSKIIAEAVEVFTKKPETPVSPEKPDKE